MRPGCDLRLLIAPSDPDESGPLEDPTFRERPVEKATRFTAPLVYLPASIDDEVDGYSETPKLFAESAVLLSTPSKVRLDHE
jgi:hypothetical protein